MAPAVCAARASGPLAVGSTAASTTGSQPEGWCLCCFLLRGGNSSVEVLDLSASEAKPTPVRGGGPNLIPVGERWSGRKLAISKDLLVQYPRAVKGESLG